MCSKSMIRALLGLLLAVTCWAQSTQPHYAEQTESDFVVRNFAFKSGEKRSASQHGTLPAT
jgi:hypothetical protein